MKQYCDYQSPIGTLTLIGSNGALEELRFPNKVKLELPEEQYLKDAGSFKDVVEQLSQYFDGRRTDFDLQISLIGTEFQKRVWQELRNIPYGKTASYGEIAERINNPKACRAVGLANNKNPIPIIVPCHRIIGKDGSLTGFGGGLELKQQLLDLEGFRD